MNCREFEEWLDDGGPGATSATARAHLQECSTCRGQLEAMTALERRLSNTAVPTPPGFLAAVMERVGRTPQMRPLALPVPMRDLMPWWVQVAAQPTTVLAFTLFALIFWQGGALISATGMAGTWLSAQVALSASYLESLFNPNRSLVVWIGLFLGFTPLLAALFFGCYRVSQTVFLSLSGARRVAARI